jgi:hypothetical protein
MFPQLLLPGSFSAPTTLPCNLNETELANWHSTFANAFNSQKFVSPITQSTIPASTNEQSATSSRSDGSSKVQTGQQPPTVAVSPANERARNVMADLIEKLTPLLHHPMPSADGRAAQHRALRFAVLKLVPSLIEEIKLLKVLNNRSGENLIERPRDNSWFIHWLVQSVRGTAAVVRSDCSPHVDSVRERLQMHNRLSADTATLQQMITLSKNIDAFQSKTNMLEELSSTMAQLESTIQYLESFPTLVLWLQLIEQVYMLEGF